MKRCKCGRWVAVGAFCCLLGLGAFSHDHEKHWHETADVVSIAARPISAVMISGGQGFAAGDGVRVSDAIFSSVTFVHRAT